MLYNIAITSIRPFKSYIYIVLTKVNVRNKYNIKAN